MIAFIFLLILAPRNLARLVAIAGLLRFTASQRRLRRVIAEAMLLEKPVIVTGHSGNMDFTQYANAAIVRCKLKSVEQGEYPYSAGQLWAEPEIEHASGLMQKIVSQATWRNKIGKTGKDTISNRYAPNAVGKEWKSILHGIYYE
jgi:hypothetical protein